MKKLLTGSVKHAKHKPVEAFNAKVFLQGLGVDVRPKKESVSRKSTNTTKSVKGLRK